MDVLYALVPLSLVLLGLAILIFFWAVRSGQFDDMDSPAHRILFDDDDHLPTPKSDLKKPTAASNGTSTDNRADD